MILVPAQPCTNFITQRRIQRDASRHPYRNCVPIFADAYKKYPVSSGVITAGDNCASPASYADARADRYEVKSTGKLKPLESNNWLGRLSNLEQYSKLPFCHG